MQRDRCQRNRSPSASYSTRLKEVWFREVTSAGVPRGAPKGVSSTLRARRDSSGETRGAGVPGGRCRRDAEQPRGRAAGSEPDGLAAGAPFPPSRPASSSGPSPARRGKWRPGAAASGAKTPAKGWRKPPHARALNRARRPPALT